MALLTITSDFGSRDYYVAALKATLLGAQPELNIIDISHEIPDEDIMAGSLVLRAACKKFPPGTVHLIVVKTFYQESPSFIVVENGGQFYIAPDNSILSLLWERPSRQVSLINLDFEGEGKTVETVVDKLALFAAELASTQKLNGQVTAFDEMDRRMNLMPTAEDHQISGQVIYIDHKGNVVSNISKEVFDRKVKGRKYTIRFGPSSDNTIHQHPGQVREGDCSQYFNAVNLLEINVRLGNAAKLFGLALNSPVVVIFHEH